MKRTIPFLLFRACGALLLATRMSGKSSFANTPPALLVGRGKYLVTFGRCNDCHTPVKNGPHGPEPDMTRMPCVGCSLTGRFCLQCVWVAEQVRLLERVAPNKAQNKHAYVAIIPERNHPILSFRAVPVAVLLSLSFAGILPADEPAALSLATTRSHFTIAEPIELAVANAGGASLEVRHADGSTLTVVVPRNVATITLRPRLLKPGAYTASVDGKNVTFHVHPDEHPNAYWTAQWVHAGQSAANAIAKGGWMYMNSDYASLPVRRPAPNDIADAYVAARMKPYARMVLGGGHQLDLDLENDWGDPWVQRAIVWRMQLAALSNRLYPLAGLHCYDEPGLTWWPFKDQEGKVTGTNPFSIPHQIDEFAKLTGKQIPFGPFEQTAPKYATLMDDWLGFMSMRMKYLEQAWHATVWATKSVHPAFETVNQVSSSYAVGDTTDGVDSRQARAYSIVSGHGGYSDGRYGTFEPVMAAEGFRGFGWDKPNYYLPTWYVHSWPTIRNGTWMSWAGKLEGLMHTPDVDFAMNNGMHGYLGTQVILEIAEINRRLALVGGVMNQLRKTPAPVAVLQSDRQVSWDIATLNHPEVYKGAAPPQYVSPHRAAVQSCFMRVMECGMAPNWIDEFEAVEKGVGFLKQWKVILCPRLTVATPEFRQALEGYIAAGGRLVQFKGDKLLLQGATVAEHDFGDGAEYSKANLTEQGAVHPNYRDLAWRKWNNDLAPSFAKDFAFWIGEQPYSAANKEILLGVHRHGDATYLLFANNAQSTENPRALKHELIPSETRVKVPGEGVIYDLFNGGRVRVQDGEASLRLPAGGGACWLHLPSEPGKMKLSAKARASILEIELAWGKVGCLPFRLRILDPAGNEVDDLFRATTPAGKTTVFKTNYPLGANASSGTWTVEVSEWLSGSTVTAKANVNAPAKLAAATADTDAVSIYFDDAKRIVDLFAGERLEPDYSKLNWDSRRVFGLDPKKFAIFGDAAVAEKLAAALRAKGMTVDVNPKYEIVPFRREPNRGGAGPRFREQNFENIYAHTIVLPGHPLAELSLNRGHINRLVTKTFPGTGRAFVQWGVSCFQAGWQNVFVFGDTEAGVGWLLKAIQGNIENGTTELTATIAAAKATREKLPSQFAVEREINTYDTPVGIGSSPDGTITYVLLFDGSVHAFDAAGKTLWSTPALLEGCALAVSPKGDRLAVAGYPGLLVLDAANGRLLGGFRAPPNKGATLPQPNRITGLAWNSAGTMIAAGWANNQVFPQDPLVLDAQGNTLRTFKVEGDIMGVAFVPNTDTLLVGGTKLTAVNAGNGAVLWSNDIQGAASFAFSADGQAAAAGGWGKNAGRFNLADGKLTQLGAFEAVVGGVALLPGGDTAVAVWGGTHPLFVLRGDGKKPETLFESKFGFQNLVWSDTRKGLLAAEQGGRLWLLGADGKPRALLDEDSGTTVYRLHESGDEVVVARMNRVVQRLTTR